MGSAKAAVLPVPVWAKPSRSLPGEDVGNGLRLDRRGRDVTLVRQRPEKRRGEPEI